MSRRVYLLGVGLILVAGALLLTDQILTNTTDRILASTPGPLESKLRRVQPGIDEGEVMRALGMPLLQGMRNNSEPLFPHSFRMGGEDGTGGVAFDHRGRVTRTWFSRAGRTER